MDLRKCLRKLLREKFDPEVVEQIDISPTTGPGRDPCKPPGRGQRRPNRTLHRPSKYPPEWEEYSSGVELEAELRCIFAPGSRVFTWPATRRIVQLRETRISLTSPSESTNLTTKTCDRKVVVLFGSSAFHGQREGPMSTDARSTVCEHASGVVRRPTRACADQRTRSFRFCCGTMSHESESKESRRHTCSD